MTEGTVRIEIPNSLFEQLKRRADAMHRPVEELVIQTLAASPAAADLTPDLAGELEAMVNFSDAALWSATRPSLASAERSRLTQLNGLAGERRLSASEAQEQAQLLASWQRSLVRRAHAFAILQLRGHPLPSLEALQAELEAE